MKISEKVIALADDIATRGNNLIEELGFDIDCNAIGYESSTGIFSEVQGDDMNEGLDDFFAWMELEWGTDNKRVRNLKKDYQHYLSWKERCENE